MNTSKTASILTLGCRVNQYESDFITHSLSKKGYSIVPFGTPADVTVVNTCTVTAESDRKSRQMIRRAVSASPDAIVIVTGCYAETGTDTISSINGVTYVTGNAKKSSIPDIIDSLVAGSSVKVNVEDLNRAPFDSMMLPSPERIRSYIKIEDGCDNRCSYCIIPSARGKVRSRPYDEIVCEASSLYSAGALEVILTGIETASYGRDFEREAYYGESLAKVIRGVSEIGFPRIGLGSLEPTVMNDGFVSQISTISTLMPHFHISVQSGSSGVLRRMRRRYNSDMLRSSIARLKVAIPDVTLSADIITGFPGETEEEFRETLEFIKETRFLHLHIFPYSIRRGTEAATMSRQLSGDIKSERLHILSDAQKVIKRELLDLYVADHRDTPVKVLAETETDGVLHGHSEHFVEVSFEGKAELIGKICNVILTGYDGDVCFGKIATE
ncbi:MAG: tRNA (N(6)-L-threonylcarbamoyladenosine(37)-C(2))-methylthiotransferase MtaB [Clostridia bacterium]|nr:tRNA (N(6)-L-threonylcarbamoyladenosine(37)-C(2))-methylthiotransferase MtaB [Clostridia bacterium]